METQLPWLFAACAVALATALGVVLARKPVWGAVLLLGNSLALAVLYALLLAEFVAVGQVIIYSGAIVVLFLFVVLLLPHGGREVRRSGGRRAAATFAAGTLLAALVYAFTRHAPQLPDHPPPDTSVAAVGHALFGPLLVPFELTTLPLLLAIVAAVTLWRRQEKEGA